MAWWITWAAAATTGTTGETGQTGDTAAFGVATTETVDTSDTSDTGVAPIEDPTTPPADTGPVDPPAVDDTGEQGVTASALAGEAGGLACDTTRSGAGLGILVLLAARRRGTR